MENIVEKCLKNTLSLLVLEVRVDKMGGFASTKMSPNFYSYNMIMAVSQMHEVRNTHLPPYLKPEKRNCTAS
jgi:hypothetical protein